MLLIDYLARFVDEHEKGVAPSTILCYYKPAISSFKRFLNRNPVLTDMTDESLNAWVSKCLSDKKTTITTIRQRRSAVLALWRAAYRAKLVDIKPDRIRRLTRPSPVVVAWTRDELKRLIAICDSLGDELMPRSTLKRRDFFRTLFLVGYETGLRLGDLLCLERDWIRTDPTGCGFVTVVQNKTKLQKTSRIEASTMAEVDNLMAQQRNRRLIWSMNCDRRIVYRTLKKLVARSGVRQGTFRYVRRSGVTHVEQMAPGTGYRHAGHADGRVTLSNYIDRSQLDDQIVSPIQRSIGMSDLENVALQWKHLPDHVRQKVIDLVSQSQA